MFTTDVKMEDVTEEQLEKYERIRRSGVTNMFDTKQVSFYSGLEKPVILAIWNHYGELHDKFPNVGR